MGAFTHIAVIVAAGKGLRMGSDTKKQFLELSGVPVLVHTLKVFSEHPQVDDIVLVVPEADMEYCRGLAADHNLAGNLYITAGGKERQDSVTRGMARAKNLVQDPQKTLVMVHDGVRPFVSHEVISACIQGASEKGACIPVVKVSDTIKVVDETGCVDETLDRSRLYRAQTPQVFRLDLGIKAFDHALSTGFCATDEASVLEHAGIPVCVTTGAEVNIKLTTPQDLVMARFILSHPAGSNT